MTPKLKQLQGTITGTELEKMVKQNKYNITVYSLIKHSLQLEITHYIIQFRE